ncbi:hypothetical protein [Nesterenkonia natronophila]|uniref:Uncharacterized protein n=1 Tax=Nesterenkonia natronophila TaxID=2174932 RepID=A0A3A4FGK0_9MICC|nr:hypothetical protein [Nesterenkonia natronophila]RJN31425.1 hypothetical protein D3250_11405 [Nesterenkonia natronophila]
MNTLASHSAHSASVPPGLRLKRGALGALIAVASAILAHTGAGHHVPHAVVIVLSLAVSVPLCVGLAGVRLSRWRMALGIVASQGALHALFALFPHAGSSGSSLSLSGPAGHEHHVDHVVVTNAGGAAASQGVVPDAPMAIAHILAAGVTYLLLRRGEVLLEALVEWLVLRPALILWAPSPVAESSRTVRWTQSAPEAQGLQDLWPGAGPRTVRGPPQLAA